MICHENVGSVMGGWDSIRPAAEHEPSPIDRSFPRILPEE